MLHSLKIIIVCSKF